MGLNFHLSISDSTLTFCQQVYIYMANMKLQMTEENRIINHYIDSTQCDPYWYPSLNLQSWFYHFNIPPPSHYHSPPPPRLSFNVILIYKTDRYYLQFIIIQFCILLETNTRGEEWGSNSLLVKIQLVWPLPIDTIENINEITHFTVLSSWLLPTRASSILGVKKFTILVGLSLVIDTFDLIFPIFAQL